MLTFVLFAMIGLVEETNVDENGYKELQSISALYEANRNEFRAGRFGFRFVNFRKASNPDTMITDPQDSFATEGVYEFDEKAARYSRLFSDHQLKETVRRLSSDRVGQRLSSFQVCTDYRMTLEDIHSGISATQTSHTAAISPGSSSFYEPVSFPLDIGFPENERTDFGKNLRTALKRNGKIELLAVKNDVLYKDRVVTVIDLRFGRTRRTFYVDLNHGGIPLLTINQLENKPPSTKVLSDVRFVPSRGWLPYRLVSYSSDGSGVSLSISKAEFDGGVPIQTRLEFPSPVQATRREPNVLYTPKKSWDLANLPAPTASNSMAVMVATTDTPAMPGETEYRTPYLAYAIGGVIITAMGYRLARFIVRSGRGPRVTRQ